MLCEIVKPIKKTICISKDSKVIEVRPIRTKLPNVAYLVDGDDKKYFYQEPEIVDKTAWWNRKSFGISLAILLSKNPHLKFITFHKYETTKPQVLFIDTRYNKEIAIAVDDFRSYHSEEYIPRDTSNDASNLSQIACPRPMTKKERFERYMAIVTPSNIKEQV
jgi:hypothetical protein